MKPRKEETVKTRGKSELQFESRVSMRGGAVVSQARPNQSHAARITSVSALGLVGPWLAILDGGFVMYKVDSSKIRILQTHR